MKMKYLLVFLFFPIFAFCSNKLDNSGEGAPKVHYESVYEVILEEDIVYAQGLSHTSVNSSEFSEMPLKLDIYTPDKAIENRPAFLFIHGGGFAGGTKQQERIKEWAQYFTSRGWVFISADYRLKKNFGTVPQAWVDYASQVPEQKRAQFLSIYPAIRDAKASLRWLFKNADSYHINTDYVTIGGGSAGAITAITVGVSDAEDYRNELSLEQDPSLASTNKDQECKVHTIIDLWGSKIGLDILRNIYSHQRFDKNDPPLFVAHGTEDPTVPFSSAEELKTIYDELDIPLAYYPLVNQKHSAWKALVNDKTLEQLAFDFIVEQQGLIVK